MIYNTDFKSTPANAESLDITKNQVMVENNAQSIFEHLKKIENEPKHHQRWIWELLQNAQDSYNGNPIDIEIRLDEKNLSFSHNGRSFTKEEITHLIFHGSSKQEIEGKTGKFGTGFMTTHLLSRKVNIKGKIENDKPFNFLLDRSGNNSKEITDTLNNSWDDFKQSVSELLGSTCDNNTEFKYLNLTDDGLKIVMNVLAQTSLLIPPVLVFSNQIGKVSIFYDDYSEIYQRQTNADEGIIEIIHSIKSEENKFSNFLVKKLKESESKLALSIDSEGSILELNSALPRIFISFPIIGTEKAIPLPFLINNSEFEPSNERDSIWLSTIDTPETLKNKNIISEALTEYCDLVNQLLASSVDNRHFLANLGQIPEVEWIDKEWFIKLIEDFLLKIDKLELIKNVDGGFISIKDGIIPISKNRINNEEAENIWNLASQVASNRVCAADVFLFWRNNIKNRETYLNNKFHESTWSLVDVCKFINNLPDHIIDDLNPICKNPFSFIQQLIESLEKFKEEFHWNDYSILPNQMGKFKKAGELKQELIGQERIDDELKNIAELLGLNIREKLLHEKIKISSENFKLQIEYKNDVLDSLLRNVKETSNREDKIRIIGNIRLFEWLLKTDNFNDLIGYPLKMRNGKWEILKPDTEQPFLCPLGVWRESFQPYVDLFPDDFILSDEFIPIFKNATILDKAVKKKWFLKDPLYNRLDEIKGDDLINLITTRSDKEKLSNQENSNWKTINTQDQSQIAYFSLPKDKNVIDRSRGSVKRTSLLIRYILNELIKEDKYGFTRNELTIENENNEQYKIGIYPCRWLLDLKTRAWVKIENMTVSDRPTVESLLPYFTREEDGMFLYNLLRNIDVARLLHFFGIGVGDLIRNIRAGDNEEERNAWDQSYVNLLMNEQLTPEKVTSLLGDPQFIQAYEEKKQQEKKIQQNQAVGREVEIAFNELIKSLPGFKIERQPIGMDYEIECDYDHFLILESEKKNKFYIEIKSARTNEVKMTVTQGTMALEKGKNYLLCVVPLDSDIITKDTIINNARFITNISQLLENRVPKVNEIIELQNKETQIIDESTELVKTNIIGTQIRYVISHKVWQTGKPTTLTLEEIFNDIKII